MTTRSSASRCLLPAATGRPSSRENWVAVLALPKSGETTTESVRSWPRKWSASTPSAVRWSTGTEKNPCTCGACRVMVSTRSTPAVDQHVGDQPAADRDPRGVLLVGAGVGVVRDHRGDLGRRRAAGGVDHQQQLHEVLLGRRHQRLDDVDVALAAVGLELGLEAVVAEPGHLHRGQLDAEGVADGGGEGPVGAAAEDDDLAQGDSWVGWTRRGFALTP